MSTSSISSILSILCILCLAGLLCAGCADPSPSVVVTTSMLAEAARDALGGADEPKIVLLLPPGACPGHFDLSPRALPALKSARTVIRHHYQGFLDEKLKEIGASGVPTISISTPSSLLIPDHYLALLDQIAEILGREFPENRARLDAARQTAAPSLHALSLEVRERAALSRSRVIVSANQKEFCEWLGLEVVGVVARPEEVSPREFEALVSTPAAAIIANLQEGTEAAESLAARKKIPLAVFSNFPNVEGYGKGYAELVRANLARLEDALEGAAGSRDGR